MKRFSLKNIRIKHLGQLFFIGLLSVTTACKDEPARIIGDVLPEGELIQGLNYDEHIIDTRNIMRDSVQTDHAHYGVIGTFNDPKFGMTKADFLTDFSMGKKVSDIFRVDSIIGIDPVTGKDTIYEYVSFDKFDNNSELYPNDIWRVDSLMLTLQYQYNNWYGDMFSKQNIKIYELTTSLGLNDTEYYSDHIVGGMYNPIPLAEKLVHPNDDVPDSLKSYHWDNERLLWEYPDSLLQKTEYLWDVDSAYLADGGIGHTQETKAWSFKLSDELAERIFNMSEAELASTTLNNILNGIYVTSDPVDGEGSLTKINLNSNPPHSEASAMYLFTSREYLRRDTIAAIEDNDTVYTYVTDTSRYVYTFPINRNNVKFNRYSHDLAGNIRTNDPSTDRLCIQGMAGSYARLQLPEEILNWCDSIKDPTMAEDAELDSEYNIVSNIEFYMEIDTTDVGIKRYPVPDKLTIKWLDENGELETPTYSKVINGNTFEGIPVFGINTGQENLTGNGEIAVRTSDDGNPEYLYRFIMNADYFNQIMMKNGNALNEKEFYIGPAGTTSDFRRVILFSGSVAEEDKDKQMRMNIKYYKYRP